MIQISWNRAYVFFSLLLQNSQPQNAAPNKRIIYKFTDCTAEQLQHLPKLAAVVELSAVTCNISILPNSYFKRFTTLTALELRESGLTTIEENALNGLDRLQWLSLAWNFITTIKSWSDEPLRALHTLDLEGNAVSVLNAESFIRFPNLNYLSLATNLLERVNGDAFKYLPHLKHLNLDHNRLSMIENTNFYGMQRLSYLSLQQNVIERVTAESFESNAHLRSLRLDGNKLQDLTFLRNKALKRLLHLSLSYNQIKTIDAFNVGEWAIIDLDVSHNYLEGIHEDTFNGLASLVHLNLSANTLHLLASSWLDKLINLESIDLSTNNLTELPIGFFDNTNQLQYINLSRNALTTIPTELFIHLPHLRLLDMSQNQLSSGTFIAHFSKLLPRSTLTLDLSENHLTQLDIDAMDALYVSGNRVELVGNWWHCQWLIVELVRAPSHINFGYNYSLAATWSAALLNVSGIDCYDVESKRSIVVLDARRLWERRHDMNDIECRTYVDPEMPTPPPLVWPHVRMDRFDSRSIIIWMLISIALAFAGLRIGRQLIDRREQRKRLRKLREMKADELRRLAPAIRALEGN